MKLITISPLTIKRIMFVTIFFVFIMPLLALGCQNQSNPPAPRARETGTDNQILKPTDFDGARALEHVRKQVELGPHFAGTPAIKQVRDYLTKELESYGLKTRNDTFRAHTPN